MFTTLAGLETHVLQQSAGRPTSAVILCHGFGAPGDDLVPLHEELVGRRPELGRTRFYFPAAPLELAGWGDARAWWHIDLEVLQRLSGDPQALRAFRQEEPAGMAQARTTLHRFVKAVADAEGLAFQDVTLGGFSQGAMIATDVALRLEEPPRGLAILSGTLLVEESWRSRARARAGLRVFQAHGREDPLLSYQEAEALKELLLDAGAVLEFFPFAGGHGITSAELDRLADFLTGSSARG